MSDDSDAGANRIARPLSVGPLPLNRPLASPVIACIRQCEPCQLLGSPSPGQLTSQEECAKKSLNQQSDRLTGLGLVISVEH